MWILKCEKGCLSSPQDREEGRESRPTTHTKSGGQSNKQLLDVIWMIFCLRNSRKGKAVNSCCGKADVWIHSVITAVDSWTQTGKNSCNPSGYNFPADRLTADSFEHNSRGTLHFLRL